jgi:hypothetical protein
VFVYQDTPRIKPPFPKLNDAQKALFPILIEDLTRISGIQGEYKWESPAAEAKYSEWYKGRLAAPNPTGDPRLNGYFERKPVHIIKLMMIVSASQRDECVLTSDDFDAALALFEQVEAKMPKVFANVGKNPLAVDYEDVAGVVLGHPGVSFSELMWMFKHSVRKDELAEILDTLVAANLIVAGPNQKYFHKIHAKGSESSA